MRPTTVRLMLAFVVVALFAVSSFAQSSQPLDPGQTIKREIRGGEGHFYEISMLPGQYAQIRLDIKGPVDLATRLINPTGQMMSRVFSASRTYAPTMGYFIADTPGVYRLLVAPVRPPLDVDTYQITFEEVRPATDKDRALVAAVDEFSAISTEGGQALQRQDVKAIMEAHAKMLAATEKLDKRDALYSIAYILSYNIAQRLVEFKRPDLADDVLKNGVSFFDRVLGPDNFVTAEMIAVLSDFYLTQNRADDRGPLLERLIKITNRDLSEENPARTAMLFMRIGDYLSQQRRYSEALMASDKAIDLLSKAEGFPNVPATVVRVELTRGNLQWLVGNPGGAIVTLRKAQDYLVKNSDIPDAGAYKGRIDYQIGISYMRMGDLKNALPLMESAVAEATVRTLPQATLKDRLMGLSRLRMYEKKGAEVLALILTSEDIVRETLPELKRIATGNNAEHKTSLRNIVNEARESENAKEVLNLLK